MLIAPSNEQQRIVAEIEKQLSRLDAGVAALKRVQANLKRYRAAVLRTACEGRLVTTEGELARQEGRAYEPAETLLQRILCERRVRWEADQLTKMEAQRRLPLNDTWKAKYQEPAAPITSDLPGLPEGWYWATIGQTTLIDSGEAFLKRDYSPDGLRLLQIANVGFGTTLWDQRNFLPYSFANIFPEQMLSVGDIVVALNRPILNNRLKVAQVRQSDLPAILYQRVGKLKSIQPYSAKWLFVFCRSPQMTNAVRSRLQGTDQPYLNTSLVPDIPLPLPPLSEQERIVTEVERRLSVIDELEATVTANLKRAERMRQAILKRAFSGQLVPQDPNDEPASVLLERILAERATSNVPNPSRKNGKRTPESTLVTSTTEQKVMAL